MVSSHLFEVELVVQQARAAALVTCRKHFPAGIRGEERQQFKQ